MACNSSLIALPSITWNHFGRHATMLWSGRTSSKHDTTVTLLTRVEMQLKLKHLITNWGLLSNCLGCHSNCLGYHSLATALVTIATYLVTLVTNILSAKKCSLGTKFIRKSSSEAYSSTLSPFVAGKRKHYERIMQIILVYYCSYIYYLYGLKTCTS